MSPATVAATISDSLRLQIRDTMRIEQERQTTEPPKIEAIVMYVCPECGEHHEYQDDAEACCASGEEERSLDGRDTRCPVCNQKHACYRDAADCCLWKELGPVARWAVADSVERGATWGDAIGMPHPFTGMPS